MIDNLSLLAFAWRRGTNSGVTNAELIASQDSQNTLYIAVLTLFVGALSLMFCSIISDLKEAKMERQEATKDRRRIELDLKVQLAEIKQLLVYTKSTEQGVPPEQVEAEVEAAARRQLDSETE